MSHVTQAKDAVNRMYYNLECRRHLLRAYTTVAADVAVNHGPGLGEREGRALGYRVNQMEAEVAELEDALWHTVRILVAAGDLPAHWRPRAIPGP